MGILVSKVYHNNVPHTVWLKQQKFLSSGGWEIQDQGVNRVGFLLRAIMEGSVPDPSASLVGVQMATLLLPLHVVFSLCTCIPTVSSSVFKF